MFMNYMDYVDDDAMFMFTTGQVARMNATPGGPAKEAGRPLRSPAMAAERADAVVGHWVHSHEEDTDAEMVYPPGELRVPAVARADVLRASCRRQLRGALARPRRRPRRVEGLVVAGGRPAPARGRRRRARPRLGGQGGRGRSAGAQEVAPRATR